MKVELMSAHVAIELRVNRIVRTHNVIVTEANMDMEAVGPHVPEL